MKVVIQRCESASVCVDNNVIGKINNGLLVLVGFTDGDDTCNIKYIVDKIVNMRLFDDEAGIMNKSVIDVRGSVLSVSQFTLYGDLSKGRRPSYVHALDSTHAKGLYEKFNAELSKYINVETGKFGADMKVNLVNDGPVTIILEK